MTLRNYYYLGVWLQFPARKVDTWHNRADEGAVMVAQTYKSVGMATLKVQRGSLVDAAFPEREPFFFFLMPGYSSHNCMWWRVPPNQLKKKRGGGGLREGDTNIDYCVFRRILWRIQLIFELSHLYYINICWNPLWQLVSAERNPSAMAIFKCRF